MVWDFPEVNPLSSIGGAFLKSIAIVADAIAACPIGPPALVLQADAGTANAHCRGSVVSTDPPYYDNVGYADLSDFFYIWLRRTLRTVFPAETSTMLVPKQAELVATPFRHGGAENAEDFFLEGMTKAMGILAREATAEIPAAIYYAFRQSETNDEGTASTGWETFLEAVIRAGFEIHGTWPVRTERAARRRDLKSNALASSIILSCVRRSDSAPAVTRAEFRRALRQDLPTAHRALQQSRIAPVDVAQATIGPGMSIFSRYAKVLEPDGEAMTVRSALRLINEVLDEMLTEQEGDFDPDTRFAVTWFEVHAFEPGAYGEAETLAKARAVSVEGIASAGIAKSGGGKVRLLKRSELPADWDPAKDDRLTVWEATQHLIKRLEERGEQSAADLLERLGTVADAARDLAYRLYSTCERRSWADEGRAYNGLVAAWPDLERLAASLVPGQQSLL